MSRYPVPAVAAVFVDGENRVWLRATDHGPRLPMRPLPGGEDWRAGLARLVVECGLHGGTERLFGLYAEEREPFADAPVPGGCVVAAFRVDGAQGNGEWRSAASLPASLPPGQRTAIADALAFRGVVVTR